MKRKTYQSLHAAWLGLPDVPPELEPRRHWNPSLRLGGLDKAPRRHWA